MNIRYAILKYVIYFTHIVVYNICDFSGRALKMKLTLYVVCMLLYLYSVCY